MADTEDNIAIGADGAPLPYSGEQVRDIVHEALRTGTIRAVLVERDGALMFQVFGPPSRELLNILQQLTTAYARALKGH